ncbi:hypothetical protein BTHE68_05970 [Burkholderia sp. THE68]|nr:hypothetical protein BTHE68_05970 [Burkholderia sp. THE68]
MGPSRKRRGQIGAAHDESNEKQPGLSSTSEASALAFICTRMHDDMRLIRWIKREIACCYVSKRDNYRKLR